MKWLSQRGFVWMLIYFSTYLLFVSSSGCSKDTDDPPSGAIPSTNQMENGWLIPPNLVVDGGPGKDGIPSIDEPQFSHAADIDFLDLQDLVLGISVDGDARAYPHPILDWHEIVNDVMGNRSFAITYCPLTGTGIGWNREIQGEVTTFGVSGLLYNSNLIPYDRKSDSHWSQMLLKSVNGELAGEEIEALPLIETTWQTWKEMFPESQVMNRETGFQRDYNRYPYGDFRTNHDFLIFSVDPDDTRLPGKQRGLGVLIDHAHRFYSLELFGDTTVRIIEDTVGTTDLVVIGSKAKNYIVAYERELPDGTQLTFKVLEDESSSAIMVDEEGTEWNIFGEAIRGPGTGTSLIPINSFMGYWFAWGAFYPGMEIYGDGE